MAKRQDAENFIRQSQEKGIDMGKVSQIMDSPEGKALLRQLSGPGGDALKHAASQAAAGESGSAARLLGALMTSKEGQALAKQVMELNKKTK